MLKVSVANIPKHISAGSPKGLSRAMLMVNRRLKLQINYFNIQWVESDKKWYAWYIEEADLVQIEIDEAKARGKK